MSYQNFKIKRKIGKFFYKILYFEKQNESNILKKIQKDLFDFSILKYKFEHLSAT